MDDQVAHGYLRPHRLPAAGRTGDGPGGDRVAADGVVVDGMVVDGVVVEGVLIEASVVGGSECQEALDTLYHFLDGELTEERRHQIQHHLDDCSPCLEAFDFEAELKIVIARRCRETVPETLRLRIATALREASISFPGPVEGAQNIPNPDRNW